MKQLFTLCFFLFLGLTINAQKASYPVENPGNYKSYISRDSITFNVGDKLEIDLPASGDRYLFISQGQAPAGTAITGAVVTIKKLIATGNQDTGFKMWAQFKGFGLLPVEIDIENALRVGEIILLKN